MILPSWLSQRQFDVLARITPGPLGKGMTEQMTADDMGVSIRTVQRVIEELKDKFPSAWERVQSMRRAMNRERKGLHEVRSLSGMADAVGFEGVDDEMLDKF